MTRATTVFLIRHAAHDRVGDTLCGRMPGVVLGEAGRSQAEALARWMAQEGADMLYASPLERARQTGEAIARRLGIGMEISEALMEIDCGAWTGRSFGDLEADPRWTEWNEARATARIPGGESMMQVQARAVAELVRLRDKHPGARIALVSHADVIKAVLAAFLGLPLDQHMRFEIAPASCSTLVLWPGGAAGGGKLLNLNHRTGENSAA